MADTTETIEKHYYTEGGNNNNSALWAIHCLHCKINEEEYLFRNRLSKYFLKYEDEIN